MAGDYVIKQGDTLSRIAKLNGTTVQILQQLNGIKDPNQIVEGKSLKLPENAGIEMEHTKSSPQDASIREKRAAAHEAQIQELSAMHSASVQKQVHKDVSSEQVIEKIMKNKGIKNGDAKYWANLVDNISKEFDIPKMRIINKINRETGFRRKNLNMVNAHGAMCISAKAAKSVFPGRENSEVYKQSNEKLYNDIFYQKDNQGNIVKDKNGQPVVKYKHMGEFYNACIDDETSIKVAMLFYASSDVDNL